MAFLDGEMVAERHFRLRDDGSPVEMVLLPLDGGEVREYDNGAGGRDMVLRSIRVLCGSGIVVWRMDGG